MSAPFPSLHQLGCELRSRQGRVADLVETCLQAIAQCEPSLHAWVLVDAEGARAQAQQLDRELSAGKPRGPLHGIPIGVKDLYDVAGWPTRAGSPLTSDRPAEADAPLVAALRQAGAILLGKTVTTEWAWIDPPETRNPRNLGHTPGGSSSGSAAAVAAGMCLAALGSQTGGSITRPASYCGICGLKPSWGLLRSEGLVPVSFHLDHPGPMAACVDDLRALFEVLLEAAYPTRRRFVEQSPAGEPAAALAGLRVGWLSDYFAEHTEPAAWQASLSAMERLRQQGAVVETLPLPPAFAGVHQAHRTIMAVEAALYHRPRFPRLREKFSPHMAALLDEGLRASALDYAAALEHRLAFRRALAQSLAQCDLLATPAATGPAPPRLDTTGDPKFNSPWSLAGVPTVSLPAGEVGGMPIALQLIGPWYGERALLTRAAAIEGALAG